MTFLTFLHTDRGLVLPWGKLALLMTAGGGVPLASLPLPSSAGSQLVWLSGALISMHPILQREIGMRAISSCDEQEMDVMGVKPSSTLLGFHPRFRNRLTFRNLHRGEQKARYGKHVQVHVGLISCCSSAR